MYAAALSLKHKYNIPVFLLPDSVGTNTHSSRDYRDIFKGVDKIEYTDLKMIMANKFTFPKIDIYDYHNEDDIPVENNKYIYIKDYYYQTYDNVKTVISEVRGVLIPQFKKSYSNLIDTPISTAFIHIRRGDFLTEDEGTRILPIEYYYKGFDILNKVVGITTVYIISDDIEWCKKHKWSTIKNIVYFDDPDELRTLYLMSQCKAGAVLSNSTFSCWGAFLGAYENMGTVVYPIHGAFLKSLPDDWIGIDPK